MNVEKGEFWIWGGYLLKIVDGMNDMFIWKFIVDGWGGGFWVKEIFLNFEKFFSL